MSSPADRAREALERIAGVVEEFEQHGGSATYMLGQCGTIASEALAALADAPEEQDGVRAALDATNLAPDWKLEDWDDGRLRVRNRDGYIVDVSIRTNPETSARNRAAAETIARLPELLAALSALPSEEDMQPYGTAMETLIDGNVVAIHLQTDPAATKYVMDKWSGRPDWRDHMRFVPLYAAPPHTPGEEVEATPPSETSTGGDDG